MMIIFLVLVIAGIYYFVNTMGKKARHNRGRFLENFVSGGSTTSLEILKKRYAEGKITLSEYEQMKDTILEDEEDNYE